MKRLSNGSPLQAREHDGKGNHRAGLANIYGDEGAQSNRCEPSRVTALTHRECGEVQ